MLPAICINWLVVVAVVRSERPALRRVAAVKGRHRWIIAVDCICRDRQNVKTYGIQIYFSGNKIITNSSIFAVFHSILAFVLQLEGGQLLSRNVTTL